MMRVLKAFYQILTGHYVQVALSWVAIFYLLITIGYWLRKRNVASEADDLKAKDIYVDQLNCLGIVAVAAGLLFVSILALMTLGITLERNRLPPQLACLTPVLVIVVVVVFVLFRNRFLR
jgi:hypothetical protein